MFEANAEIRFRFQCHHFQGGGGGGYTWHLLNTSNWHNTKRSTKERERERERERKMKKHLAILPFLSSVHCCHSDMVVFRSWTTKGKKTLAHAAINNERAFCVNVKNSTDPPFFSYIFFSFFFFISFILALYWYFFNNYFSFFCQWRHAEGQGRFNAAKCQQICRKFAVISIVFCYFFKY